MFDENLMSGAEARRRLGMGGKSFDRAVRVGELRPHLQIAGQGRRPTAIRIFHANEVERYRRARATA